MHHMSGEKMRIGENKKIWQEGGVREFRLRSELRGNFGAIYSIQWFNERKMEDEKNELWTWTSLWLQPALSSHLFFEKEDKR